MTICVLLNCEYTATKNNHHEQGYAFVFLVLLVVDGNSGCAGAGL